MAVAEYHPVVIPARGPVLDGFIDDQVELFDFGLAGEAVDFKDGDDFDHCERDGVLSVFLLVLLGEQLVRFWGKTRCRDFYVRHLLKTLLNDVLTDVQFVDGIGYRTMTPRSHFGPDLYIGGAVVQTEILILKFCRKFQDFPRGVLCKRPPRHPCHRIIGMRRAPLDCDQEDS